MHQEKNLYINITEKRNVYKATWDERKSNNAACTSLGACMYYDSAITKIAGSYPNSVSFKHIMQSSITQLLSK